jgi:hypothetical protein
VSAVSKLSGVSGVHIVATLFREFDGLCVSVSGVAVDRCRRCP